MASKVPNTIVLKGHGIRKEYKAGAALYPGNLVMLGSTEGEVILATARATVAHPPRRMIAVENDIEGKGIKDQYASGANVLVEHLVPGQEVLLIASESLNLAAGAAAGADAGEIVAGAAAKIPDFYALGADLGDDTAPGTNKAYVKCVVA